MKDLTVGQLEPMAGFVLVEPAQAETKTASGIILPENDSEKPTIGTVLAVGPADCDCGDSCGCGSCGSCGSCGGHYGCGGGCEDCEECEPDKKSSKKDKKEHAHDDCDCGCGCGAGCGCGCSAPVEVGDQVVYKKWGGNEVTVGDTEYQFLKFEDILAVVRKK